MHGIRIPADKHAAYSIRWRGGCELLRPSEFQISGDVDILRYFVSKLIKITEPRPDLLARPVCLGACTAAQALEAAPRSHLLATIPGRGRALRVDCAPECSSPANGSVPEIRPTQQRAAGVRPRGFWKRREQKLCCASCFFMGRHRAEPWKRHCDADLNF